MIVNKKRAPETVPTPPTGYLTLFIRSDTGVPAVKNSDGVVSDLVIPGDASGVTFTPMDNLDWTDSVDPGNVDDALNDLARRMVAVESVGATDASQVTYTPSVNADWDGDIDPGDTNDALDQLAQRVTDIEESPGSGSSFGTFAVSGQDNVVADQSSDTVTFAASGGLLTITTNAGTDTITFTVSAPDASVVTFTPGNSLHWTDSEDPGNVDDALDDLAARIQAVEETESSFRNIAVSGQGTIVADGSNDTLTLAAGSNITITTDPTTDTVTIASSGGGAGSLVLLEQYTASSSATLDFTTFISSTYDEYVFELVAVLPATNGVDIVMRFGTGVGPSWDSGSNYEYAGFITNSSAASAHIASTSATSIRILPAISNVRASSGSLRVFDLQGSNYKTVIGHVIAYGSAPAVNQLPIGGAYKITTAVTGIRFLASSGNIASGTIRVYGIVKS